MVQWLKVYTGISQAILAEKACLERKGSMNSYGCQKMEHFAAIFKSGDMMS